MRSSFEHMENHTEIIIDRDREAKSHALCAQRGLAPPLLARFRNGPLVQIHHWPGLPPLKIWSAKPVWRAVARRLGEWHARLPISAVVQHKKASSNGANGSKPNGLAHGGSGLESRSPVPNIWTVMQKWVLALPRNSPKQEARIQMLQKELDRSFQDLDNQARSGLVWFRVRTL